MGRGRMEVGGREQDYYTRRNAFWQPRRAQHRGPSKEALLFVVVIVVVIDPDLTNSMTL